MDFFKSLLCPISLALLLVLLLVAPMLVVTLASLVLEVVLERDETCKFSKLVLLSEVLNKEEDGCVCVPCSEFELEFKLAFETED